MKTKDHYWPDEGRTPRPQPVKTAARAAWKEFWRVLRQQQRTASLPDPFKEKA